jgi:serine O-acetyltransferase
MNFEVKADLYRYQKKKGIYQFIKAIIRIPGFRWMVLFRLHQKSKIKLFYRILLHKYGIKYGFIIGRDVQIGGGLYLPHLGSIVINNSSIIGQNCNILQGVTIGHTQRGNKMGSPQIGNNVYIGPNAVLVGKINIGNNVLIAPLAYVNVDVPANSIVIGNPARIISKMNATEGYINNTIDKLQ